MKLQVEIDQERLQIETVAVNGNIRIRLEEDTTIQVKETPIPGKYLVVMGTKHYHAYIRSCERDHAEVEIDHIYQTINYKTERELLLERFTPRSEQKAGDEIIKAPIPGLLLKMLVKIGDEIKSGQPVAILEAMKMENEIHASHSGVVAEIMTQEGNQVNKNQPIIRIKQ